MKRRAALILGLLLVFQLALPPAQADPGHGIHFGKRLQNKQIFGLIYVRNQGPFFLTRKIQKALVQHQQNTQTLCFIQNPNKQIRIEIGRAHV